MEQSEKRWALGELTKAARADEAITRRFKRRLTAGVAAAALFLSMLTTGALVHAFREPGKPGQQPDAGVSAGVDPTAGASGEAPSPGAEPSPVASQEPQPPEVPEVEVVAPEFSIPPMGQ